VQLTPTVNYSSKGIVTWSLDPNIGTITSSGLYTAPADVTAPQTVTVTATSVDRADTWYANSGGATYTAATTITVLPQPILAAITVPGSLQANVISNSEIDLEWTPSTEPGASIAGYHIFRNGTWTATSLTPSFADRGLLSSTAYTYTVAAFDASWNSSAKSVSAGGTTLAGIPNLVAHYNLDEGVGAAVYDSSGNGNNGAITGTPVWSNSGKTGGALAFDGATNLVTVPSSSSLSPTTGMTLEAWVNPAVLPPADVSALIGKSLDGTMTGEQCFALILTASDVDFDLQTAAGMNLFSGGTQALPLNTWTHLALTYDGAGIVTLFVNGQPLAVVNGQQMSPPITGALATSAQPLFIGGVQPFGEFFKGMIDEIRIYDRALSQAEIQNDIASSSPQPPTLSTITPASGVQGTSVPVTLQGTGFAPGVSVTVNNPGLAVGDVTVVSATEITANFTIAASATLGGANVTVAATTGMSNAATFTIGSPVPPVITAVTATPGPGTVTIGWSTDKGSSSRVDYGVSPTTLSENVSDAAVVTSHSIVVSGLTSATTYYFRVTSVDGFANSATWPVASSSPASFTAIDTTPPVISAVTVAPGTGGTATISWATNKPSSSRVDFGNSSSALSLNQADATLVTAHSITLTGLTSGATYYYRVTSADVLGNTSSSPSAPDVSSLVDIAGVSVWNSSATPDLVDSEDSNAVELGLKFRSDVSGVVTGVRFYKAAANTGTHTGHLWSNTGNLLGSVTFVNETASGWQLASFDTPVPVTANTTYVISYFVPNGHYSANRAFFGSTGIDNPPLHALASGVDGSNGVFNYGSTSSFPSDSWNDCNYWVDPVFSGNVPLAISAVTATTTATTATIAWSTGWASSSRVDYGTSADALNLSSTITPMGTSHSIALTGLTPGLMYYYRVSSTDAFGNSAIWPLPADPASTFTAVGFGIFTNQVPTTYGYEAAYELGTKFWADVDGQITQVTLYTNATEGGTHSVRIWRASDSALLAGPYLWNITSGSEGWKSFALPTPLVIIANTDYVVAISNSGDQYYAAQLHGFDAPIVNESLHTYVGSGVFTTTMGTMPTDVWQNANYFRDIVFIPR
jgi:hypothetical protein